MIFCPKCGSKNIIPILYGYPNYEAVKSAKEGKIKLGGCIVDFHANDKYCNNCGYEWSRLNMTEKDIVKVRYRLWIDEQSKEKITDDSEAQWSYDIYPDGRIKFCSYPINSRKILNKEMYEIKYDTAIYIYNHLNIAFNSREFFLLEKNVNSEIVTDCYSYELTITYSSGQKVKNRNKLEYEPVCNLFFSQFKEVPKLNKTIKRFIRESD